MVISKLIRPIVFKVNNYEGRSVSSYLCGNPSKYFKFKPFKIASIKLINSSGSKLLDRILSKNYKPSNYVIT